MVYRCEDFAMAVLLQEAIRVGTAQSEHLLCRRASVPQATNPGFRPAWCLAGKNKWKIKQDLGVADKDISVVLVINTHCEIKNVNNQCQRLGELSPSILVNKLVY